MGKVVVVTSGKGGVGKTTSTAALGAALARSGSTVAVVDFDVGLRNLDLVMGAERRVIHDLTSVVEGTAELSEALLPDVRLDTLWLLPASQTRGKEALTEYGVARVVQKLRDQFEWVICDSPAGNERGAVLAMRFADEAIIVVNPEISSVRDAGRITALVDTQPVKVSTGERLGKHLLITRFDPRRVASGEMLSLEDVCTILPAPLLGIVPESEEVLRASNLGAPITVCGRDSDVSRAYIDAARRLRGDPVTMVIPAGSRGIFNRLLGGRAA
jgi:septum site-determining protein MinD